MNLSNRLGLLVLLGVASFALVTRAQSGEQPMELVLQDRDNEWGGGTADQWLAAILDSTVDQDAEQILGRLSFFQLTSDQVNRLQAAAQEAESETRRMILWHAIRLSRDRSGRKYLIQKLVNESTAETQIQFLESLRNPGQFDVPILVALYNCHRPQRKGAVLSQPSSPNVEDHPLNSRSNTQTPEESKERKSTSKNETKAEENSTQSKELDAAELLREEFNVPRKLVQLVCQSEWNQSLVYFEGEPNRVVQSAPGEVREIAIEARWQKWRDAERAQQDMVRWLIKHGFEDGHRINAFEKHLAGGKIRYTSNVHNEFARLLLLGLDDPDSKAKVILFVSAWVDLNRFLFSEESETVRISAVDAIEKIIVDNRRGHYPNYLNSVASHKPLLEEVRDSDPSEKVRDAARLVLETIAEFEKMDAEATERAGR